MTGRMNTILSRMCQVYDKNLRVFLVSNVTVPCGSSPSACGWQRPSWWDGKDPRESWAPDLWPLGCAGSCCRSQNAPEPHHTDLAAPHLQAKTFAILQINSLAPGTFERNFRYFIFKLILVIDGWVITTKISPRYMSVDLTDDKSTYGSCNGLVPSGNKPYYLSQCWPTSLLLCSVTRPQVNKKLGWNEAISENLTWL